MESVPQSVSEYKKLFAMKGISIEGLKGKRAFKERYEEFLKEMDDGSDTDDMSDEENQEFMEIDFEGVEYLEDEETGLIYTTSRILMGKWNDNMDDIIWEDESFKIDHDSKKD